jgi:hypothetical protein
LRLLPPLRPVLLPDDPRLEPEPELERVLDPELREDPDEDPDQLLFREEEELRVVVLREDELRVDELRVLEPEFDPLELPHEEFEREERVVVLRAGEMYSGLVLDDCVEVDVGRVDVAAGREDPVPTASTPRQMVMGAAGSPVA